MLHFLLDIIIMTRSTKTRLLLRDKCKVVHSDRLYRPHVHASHSQMKQKAQHPCHPLHKLTKQNRTPRFMKQITFNITHYTTIIPNTMAMADSTEKPCSVIFGGVNRHFE